AADYDAWAAMGNTGWSWDDVLPVFKDVEDHHAGESEFHGGSGSWRVERQRLSRKILDAFRQAAQQTGTPSLQDFKRGDNEGCAYFEVNQRRGVRWTAAKAFLHPVASRSNLTVLTGAHVQRLLFEGRRATGLRFMHDGQAREASARREIILSAGSIGS